MLFFGVFLRETARPVAESRTNLAQIQEKLPNRWTDWHQIWHTCADSSGNGYMPNQLNLNSAAAEAQKGLYLRSYPYRRYNKLILVSF